MGATTYITCTVCLLTDPSIASAQTAVTSLLHQFHNADPATIIKQCAPAPVVDCTAARPAHTSCQHWANARVVNNHNGSQVSMIADANFTILELANILRQVLTTGAYEGQRHVGQGVPIPTIGLAKRGATRSRVLCGLRRVSWERSADSGLRFIEVIQNQVVCLWLGGVARHHRERTIYTHICMLSSFLRADNTQKSIYFI